MPSTAWCNWLRIEPIARESAAEGNKSRCGASAGPRLTVSIDAVSPQDLVYWFFGISVPYYSCWLWPPVATFGQLEDRGRYVMQNCTVSILTSSPTHKAEFHHGNHRNGGGKNPKIWLWYNLILRTRNRESVHIPSIASPAEYERSAGVEGTPNPDNCGALVERWILALAVWYTTHGTFHCFVLPSLEIMQGSYQLTVKIFLQS